MKCSHCNKEIGMPQGSFCPFCGSKIEHPASPNISTSSAKQRARQMNRRKITWMLLITLTILICSVIFNLQSNAKMYGDPFIMDEILINLGNLLIWAVIIDIGYIWWNNSKKCPSCGAYNAIDNNNVKITTLSEKLGYQTRNETQDVRSRDGSVVGRVDVSRQVRVKKALARHGYQCKYCGYQWYKDKESVTDTFDD